MPGAKKEPQKLKLQWMEREWARGYLVELFSTQDPGKVLEI